MPQKTLSLKVGPLHQARLRQVLAEAEFDFDEAPHAFWRGRGPGCVATFYESGKLVLQGERAEFFAAVLGLDEPTVQDPADRVAAALARHPDPKPQAWIGSDEVGKGDFFGPLVAVAARVTRDQVPLLLELGVADSKTLSDGRMKEIAKDLSHVVAHETVVVGPEAYNRLHAKLGNLNRLLAWAHARAIGDLVAKGPVDYVLVDRFADESVLRRQLGDLTQALRLDQRPRAEEDPAVAAASILARIEFLRRMAALSRRAGLTLPRGAGPPVLAAGRKLVVKLGPDALGQYAKLHFRTTRQVLGD